MCSHVVLSEADPELPSNAPKIRRNERDDFIYFLIFLLHRSRKENTRLAVVTPRGLLL